MNVLTYNLAGINFLSRIDEEFSTILQLVYTVGISCSCLHGNHRTVDTTYDFALVRLILLEAVSHDSLALRSGKHVGTQTDDTT